MPLPSPLEVEDTEAHHVQESWSRSGTQALPPTVGLGGVNSWSFPLLQGVGGSAPASRRTAGTRLCC